MLPLEGITVVSLEQAVAAPFATRQLADLGARVIKIERPGTGDFARHYDNAVNGMSSYFTWLNRSKESVTLDLKRTESRHILDLLLGQADVLAQNLAPGAVERLGYGWGTLKDKYPRLIMANISGYGPDGPYRDRKAYDLLIQCETGLTSMTGTADAPSKVGISIADIAAGMYAYTGILTALLTRARTGAGTRVDVSMLEALGEWMSHPLYYSMFTKREPARTGLSHATIYPYGPFSVAGNKQIFVAVQNDREWENFCSIVLKMPFLANEVRFQSNAHRVKNRFELKEIIEAVFEQLSLEVVMERLEAANVATAHMNSVLEFAEHPQLTARNRWHSVESPVGPLPALCPPVQLEGMGVKMGSIPELGEHTLAILQQLGFAPDAVEELRVKGVI